MNSEVVLSVSDFVAVVNQTLEYAYGSVIIVGELANFKVSKNKWIYFDLKDELASVRFFGSVYALPGPLEDGMICEVRGNPRLHPQFGFSVAVQSIRPTGEGSIKKAAQLLESKLRAEGLFDDSRKRPLPYPPRRIGLITSKESAAYADFIKIVNQRWRGLKIELIDVQVQGEAALRHIVGAVEQFNQLAEQPDILVLIRGGGSADDLQVFSTEQVARTVAGSRIPTLVAIGHEVDMSLAELAADYRASTPSNAAELIVPDRREVLHRLKELRTNLARSIEAVFRTQQAVLEEAKRTASHRIEQAVQAATERLERQRQLVAALSPQAALRRGYAIVRKNGKIVRSSTSVAINDIVNVQLFNANLQTQVKNINAKEKD